MIRKSQAIFVPLFVWATLSLDANALSDDIDTFNTCKKAEQGAKRDIPSAQFVWGLMNAIGRCSTFGIKQPSTAAAWWQRAADQGQPDAQFSLGVSYLKGLGVEKNVETAYRLINLAARNGSGEARNFLAICSDRSKSACR